METLDGLFQEVLMAHFQPLPFDPFKWMFIVQDRPWDTHGPNLAWSEFLALQNCLLQDQENWQNQRDELLDQINILQNALIKNGIPLPNLESAGGTCSQ